jgi:prepilin-type N-terminal cleavage/methylation domain-containing protein
MKYRTHPRSKAGFSLMELLLVVAIIGIISSVVVMMMGRRHYIDSREAVARKNAQQFVSLCMMAQAAGSDPVQSDVMTTLLKLKAGVTATDGAFSGQTFRLSGVAEPDMQRAAYYLELRDGELQYLPAKQTNTAD